MTSWAGRAPVCPLQTGAIAALPQKGEAMETESKGAPSVDVLIGTVVREGADREGGVTPTEVAEVLTAEGYELSGEDAARRLAELAAQGSITESETTSVPSRYLGV